MNDVRVCSECGLSNVRVLDTRITTGGCIRRRIECQNCGYRFTTYELHEDDFKSLCNGDNVQEASAVIIKKMIGEIKGSLTSIAAKYVK